VRLRYDWQTSLAVLDDLMMPPGPSFQANQLPFCATTQ
jgi:hypothetical protein